MKKYILTTLLVGQSLAWGGPGSTIQVESAEYLPPNPTTCPALPSHDVTAFVDYNQANSPTFQNSSIRSSASYAKTLDPNDVIPRMTGATFIEQTPGAPIYSQEKLTLWTWTTFLGQSEQLTAYCELYQMTASGVIQRLIRRDSVMHYSGGSAQPFCIQDFAAESSVNNTATSSMIGSKILVVVRKSNGVVAGCLRFGI